MHKTLNILLIEDNPGDVKIIREMLADAQASSPAGIHYTLSTEAYLRKGLERGEKESFDVLLLDLTLPDSTGLDTFRRVHDKSPAMPIIVLSGLDDEEVAIQAVGEGAQDYLVKGQVDGNLISRAMHYAVERKRIEEEKTRIQEQLLQSQKMEAIGTLAGGVAHDFNNLMTAIQGFTDVIMLKTDESNPIMRALNQIRSAATNAADLTRQMLLFSRKHPTRIAILDFNKVIDDLLTMLHRVIGDDIEIRTGLEENLWKVRADRASMEQLIMNLTLNARDAMPRGGKILITTENVILDEAYCKLNPECKSGEHVRVSVADGGVGIPKDIIDHIFEPFFSTKGPGKGTGLGLSVCYGIVKQHEGCILVQSKVGKGSTFVVHIPAQFEEAAIASPEAINLEGLQGYGRRILFVEDAEGVREFASLALEENGYRVLTAPTATEAIDIYDREGGRFDLVVTDVVLPDRSGLDLITRLLSQNEKQKILISSGYTDQKSQWPVIRDKGYHFLQKPYAYTDLLKAVKEALETQQKTS
ncbi:MAG TPA: hybrid sensor histidine kinase/response regulator [bacterium]|nr:hybrid sensor histidine kinase/response regulator [bacterium]